MDDNFSQSSDEENEGKHGSIMFHIKPISNSNDLQNKTGDFQHENFAEQKIRAPPQKHFIWGAKKRHVTTNDAEKNSLKNIDQNNLFQSIESKEKKEDNFQDNQQKFDAKKENNLIIETDLDKIFEQKQKFLQNKKINLSKPTNIDDFIVQTNKISLIITV